MTDQPDEFIKSGFSIIPCKSQDKRPALGSWSEFQERRPTPEEVQEWTRTLSPDAWAVICGKVSDGLYVVDVDSPLAERTVIGRWMKYLGPTRTICSSGMQDGDAGSGKRHFYFKDEDSNLKKRSFKFENITKDARWPHVDLQGEGSYVLLPGSKHPSGTTYETVDDSPIATIPYEKVYEVLRVLKQHVRLLEVILPNYQLHARHYNCLALGGYAYHHGFTLDEALILARSLSYAAIDPVSSENDAERAEEAIRSTYERAENGTPVGYKAETEGDIGWSADLVEKIEALPERIRFSQNAEARVRAEYNLPEEDEQPIPEPEKIEEKKPKKKGPEKDKKEALWRIARPLPLPEPDDSADTAETWNEIISWLKDWNWFKDEKTFDIIALWLLHTYLTEHDNIACLLVFHGITRSGKTQATIASLLIARHGYVALDPSVSVIFRFIGLNPTSTLGFDEFTYHSRASAEDNDVADMFRLLRGSVVRGVKVLRTERVDGIFYPAEFEPFGPKVINTTRLDGIPKDLLDRSLVLVCLMPPSKIMETMGPIGFVDNERCQRIRAKIQGVINRELSNGLPSPLDMANFSSDTRLRDIGRVLGLPAVIFGKEDTLFKFLQEQKDDRMGRMQEDNYGMLVQVIKSIFDARGRKDTNISIEDIRMTWLNFMNLDEENARAPTRRMIGGMITKLGFEKVVKKTETKKTTSIIANEQIICQLEQLYGL